MKFMPCCAAAALGLALTIFPSVEAMGPSPWIRVKTDLQGLDVAVRTSTGPAAITRLENRTDRTVFCSVGFFHGFDLRKRTAHALGPGEKRSDVYPIRQLVGSVPVEVVCSEHREALPHNYF